YDTGTVARDLIGLMDALGHERIAVAGHDTGFAVGYALAADYADRVTRVALAEIPAPPGATPAPPLFVPRPLNEKLWHIPFNRAAGLPEQLIAGREDVYFGYEFAIQGGGVAQKTIDYYISLVSDPTSLTGSLGFYRSFDETLAQNAERAQRKLTVPVLAIGGERSYGAHVEENMHGLAEDVTGLVLRGAGHWVAEEAPEQLLDALRTFLAPDLAASAAR
ncbi:alpha/beta fold hydrolase, partial [Agromyces sp. CCNWLW208]